MLLRILITVFNSPPTIGNFKKKFKLKLIGGIIHFIKFYSILHRREETFGSS